MPSIQDGAPRTVTLEPTSGRGDAQITLEILRFDNRTFYRRRYRRLLKFLLIHRVTLLIR